MSKDITDSDEEFIEHCKEATRHLTKINNRLHKDDELTSLEALSFSLTLMSVTCLNETMSDDEDESSSNFKWDDDHTFK